MMIGDSRLLSRKAYSKWEGSSLSFGMVKNGFNRIIAVLRKNFFNIVDDIKVNYVRKMGFYKGDIDVKLLEVLKEFLELIYFLCSRDMFDGKIYDDIDLFKDFESDFPAIVYNDALASDPEVSYEPTVSPHNAIKADFDFTISFFESDDEDYTFIYDKISSSYKLINVNYLKSDTGNDIDEINVKLPSEDISIKPLDGVINVNVDTYSQEFDKTIETNHDTPGFYMAHPGFWDMAYRIPV
ncbi:hypothetical protein Tco_0308696 [Tanacetum coccineum]